MPKIDAVEIFYLRGPEILDISDNSQDATLIRISAGGEVGWGECDASPLPSISALVGPMSHVACRPVNDSVLGEALDALLATCNEPREGEEKHEGRDVGQRESGIRHRVPPSLVTRCC